MAGEGDRAGGLERVPTRAMHRRLVRCVPALDFLEGTPPSFLYTSGRPNRCNPAGVDCLYFSEGERVATLEFRRMFSGTGVATPPKLTFIAEVDLHHVIDLEKAEVKRALDLSSEEILQPWRDAVSPTRLQQLGLAVNRQRVVGAIRYPSDACRRAGTKGWNVAIFPDAVAIPSGVRIIGRSGAVLEEWP